MKRMTYFVMVLALVLGFTQCKKEQTNDSNAESNIVPITLRFVNNSDSRVEVDPTGNNGQYQFAPVKFENGDKIYVGYHGQYVGELTCSNANVDSIGTFSGEVSISQTYENEKLHFYLLGGNSFSPVRDGNTFTVNISDQTFRYPVISYATSKETYPSNNNNYTAILKNKCSIMKFNVETPSSSPICIMGMNNKVTVDFTNPGDDNNNGFAYDMDGVGEIKMHSSISGNGTETTPYEMWAIVLPQGEVAAGANMAYTSTLTKGDYYTGTRPLISEIGSNQYISTGVNLTVNIPPKYSVSSTQQVEFAPGNLRYIMSSSSWSFMEHQYSYSEAEGLNDKIWNDDLETYAYEDDDTVTLFKWGANGLSGGEKPYSITTKDSKYESDLTPAQDWGVQANTANLGGYHNWRTPSMDEWSYVASRQLRVLDNNTKVLVDTAAYGFAVIDKMKGFILLPDNWNGAIDPDFVYGFVEGETNVYTASSWESMEAAGVVFLPAAGYRAAFFMTEFWLVGTYWSTNYGGISYDEANHKNRTCAWAFTFNYHGQGYDGDVYEAVYDDDDNEITPGLTSEDYDSYTIPYWTTTDWRTWTKPTHNPQPGSYTPDPRPAPDPDRWEADNDFTYYASSVRLIRDVE